MTSTSITPLTEISATPRNAIENFNFDGPNKHKYSVSLPMPTRPKDGNRRELVINQSFLRTNSIP